MNWGKTKMIFIICFLLLDLFLGYQLYQRQKESQISTIDKSDVTSERDELQMNVSFPANVEELSYIKGSLISFVNDKNEIKSDVKGVSGKAVKLDSSMNGRQLTGYFKDNVDVEAPDSGSETKWQSILMKYIYKGNEYKLWKYEKKEKVYTFVQTYNGQLIFATKRNQDVQEVVSLKIYVNEAGEIIKYTQSYINGLVKTKQIKNDYVLQPQQAKETLASNNNWRVLNRPRIVTFELSYFSIFSSGDSNTILFVPAWRIGVQTEKEYNEYFVTVYGPTLNVETG